MPIYDKEAHAEQMKARTKDLTDRLETGMSELYNSDKYKAYLTAMSQFHQYSTKNIMLIHQQMPDASRIASYALWKEKFSRQVKKGETGLYIYAPAKQKEPEKVLMEKLDPITGEPLFDKDNQPIMEEMTPLSALRTKFVLVPVFDISQTYGEPLPELVENITGNVAHYEAFMDALKAVSTLPIKFEPMDANQDGYCRFGENIGIREDMSESQTVCAIVHEIVHDRLHDKNNQPENAKPKKARIQEIEAESISYVVCQHYGIETSPNSFGYLAEHGSQAELKASIDTIRKEANGLITALDERFTAICQERGIDLTAKEPEQAATVLPETEKPAEQSYTTETRTENIAGVDFEYLDVLHKAAVKEQSNQIEQKSFNALSALFPEVMNGEYSYLRLESENMEPLSLEWIGGNRLSVMHTYTQNGDLMYDPMMVFEIDREAKTATAVEFEQSNPPLYQQIDEDGIGHNMDGNGNERVINDLQRQLNDFASDWFKNIDEQGYMPERANMVMDGEDVRVAFDKDGKPIMPETAEQDVPEQDTPDIIMPDQSIGISEMNLYGYTADDMLPLTSERALELFNADQTIYLLYDDNTEMMAYDSDEIITFGSSGIFGITKADWERSPLYTELFAHNAEPAAEAEIENDNPASFSIYQLKDIEEMRYHRFASLKQLEADNLPVDRANYDLAYTAPLPPKQTLEELFEKFNNEHPKDYTGRSMSVSDVVVIERGGEVSAHYVDNFGFAEVPDFFTVRNEQARVQPEIPKHEIPVYKFTGETARQNGELDAFRASIKLNKECGETIDTAIRVNSKNGEMAGTQYVDTKAAVKSVIEEYGADRVAWVLAANINNQDWDGRLSNTNKAWAKEFDTPKPDYYLRTHLTILDSFSNRFREAITEKPSLIKALNDTEQRIKQQKLVPAIDGRDKAKKSDREDI